MTLQNRKTVMSQGSSEAEAQIRAKVRMVVADELRHAVFRRRGKPHEAARRACVTRAGLRAISHALRYV
jgi:hypothetical protein